MSAAISTIAIHFVADLPAVPQAHFGGFCATPPTRVSVEVQVNALTVRARCRETDETSRRYGPWFLLMERGGDGYWIAPSFNQRSRAGRIDRVVRRHWDRVVEAGRKIGTVIP